MPTEKQYDVVISGISGLYPECNDVNELWSKLVNKEDMVTTDKRRWTPGELDVPPATGKVPSPEKFDLTFFGIHRKLCEKMDPSARHLCEQGYRAICDAGVNPKLLDGSHTAVIMSSIISEPELYFGYSESKQGNYNVLAVSRTMQANRLSYFLNLTGPSFQVDCSGVGGILAIQTAYDLISRGICNAAIVGSSSTLFKPELSFHYQAMGRLSEDGVTRAYSSDAAGYARSEATVTLFLQRKDHAKRIYATVKAADVLCHGSKSQSFNEFPNGRLEPFLTNLYKEAKVEPEKVTYVEGYGSASKTLDAMELNALSKVMLNNKRTDPLLIGTVKSNLGHTEGCSSMVSLTKVLLALNQGIIPPNINYKDPNPNVPALVSGQMQVVTELTPVSGTIVAVNELGVTSNCSHIVLEAHDKVKAPRSMDSEEEQLPFLVTMSGRSEEMLAKNMEDLETIGIDEELVILLNSLYREGIRSHAFRGYSVISDKPNTYHLVVPAPNSEKKKPIWFMYSGMGSQWPTMAKALMALPVFAKAINFCHETLLPKGINLLEIVTKDEATIFDVILNSFVGIAAVQIGLTDVLKAVGVVPDGIIGHSVGELGCAYADGCLTAEQMILSAHARGRASAEARLIKGMMAAVGAGYNTIKGQLPEPIEVACHNSKDSCTLSGPAEDMETFVAQLKAKGMFAKLVNVANIAYHSRYIKPAAPALLKYLKEIIPLPAKRSSKWLSSSIIESKWDSELAQYSSAEYHTNNLLSSVLFEEASAHIPPNAIVIEIAPHGLLQAIVKRSLPQAIHIPLTSRTDGNNLMFLLASLGKMFCAGIPVDLQALYPSATFPVSRGTPAISPMIDWLREDNFHLKRVMDDSDMPSPVCKFFTVQRGCDDSDRLLSHKISGQFVLPTGFFYRHIFGLFTNIGSNDGLPIIIQNFNVYNLVEIDGESPTEIKFQFLQGTGNLVVSDFKTDMLVAELNIYAGDEAAVRDLTGIKNMLQYEAPVSNGDMMYFMKSKGLERDYTLTAIDDISFVGNKIVFAVAQWDGSIGNFLSSLLSLAEFTETRISNYLKLFNKCGEIKINLPFFTKTQPRAFIVRYDMIEKTLRAEGVAISRVECKNPGISLAPDSEYFVELEVPKFVPYVNESESTFKECATTCMQMVFENTTLTHDTIIKVIEIGNHPDLHYALKQTTESPKYAGNTQVIGYASENEFLNQGLSILLQEEVLIVIAEPASEEMLKSIENMKAGFILMPKLKNGSIFKVLYEMMVNGARYTLSPIKCPKRQYEITHLKEGYLAALEKQLASAGEIKTAQGNILRTVILWGQVDSMVAANIIVEESKDLPNNHFLHYWLFHGKVPEFDLGDEELKKQIERDARVNIFEGGHWGSLRTTPANIVDAKIDAARPTTFYFPMSAVAELQQITALGLNLPDAEGSVYNLGVYDYVNQSRMGIGNYDPSTKTFLPDDILTWPKPNHWTAEEAASVPLLYSLASYILHHTNNEVGTDDRTIMVNQGLLPLSQAIISLALYEKMRVYTSVYGEQEKERLGDLFPKLKKENIYDCSTVAMSAEVLRNVGHIYKVINNFDNSQMIGPCATITRPYGVLIYVSQPLLNSGATMGMLKFLDSTVALAASSDILMKSSHSVKVAIQRKLQLALKHGGVIPIQAATYLHPTTLNVDAVHCLKSSPLKVIVSMKDNRISPERKLYIKDESNTHIIVEGKIQGELRLDILEWLMKRGSQKVVMFLRQSNLADGSALRVQSLKDQYKSATIDIRPSSHLSSRANIDKFIRECPKPGLAMAFFLGSGLKEKIELFDEALSTKVPGCNVVCIGKGGEEVCDRRKKNSLPALFVRCSTAALEGVNICQYLDDLLISPLTAPGVVMKKSLIQRRSNNGLFVDLLHVPKTNSELYSLYHQSTTCKSTLIEIPTGSPPRQFTREVHPVFLFPGLRPNRLHTMASQFFCPAFEVRLPENATDIDMMAEDLAQQLAALPQNTFTLVGDDWGGILTLHVASKLEALSKIVAPILLDASPASITKTARGLLENENALIRKYLTLPPGVDFDNKLTSWDEKVKFAVENSGLEDDEVKKLATNGLNLLKRRLLSVVDAKPPSHKLKYKCHVMRIPSQSEDDFGLSDYLQKPPVVHVKGSKTIDEMIDNEVAADINTLHLHEHRDAANPLIEEYIGLNTVKKPHWQSSFLHRVRE